MGQVMTIRHLMGAVLVAGGVFLTGLPAAAVVTCSVSLGTATVAMASGDTATLSIGPAGQINVNGSQCSGTATTTNIDTVVVNGAGGAETVNLSLAGGPFAPGASPESSGVPEIEISVSLAGGSDTLVITGSSGSDAIEFGTLGVNVNDDDDTDVTISAVEVFVVNAGDGPDTVSGEGGDDTGLPFLSALTLNGESGTDTLTGGATNDSVSGGAGSDALVGGGGNDVLLAGAEDDTLSGEAGNDWMDGGSGGDTAQFSAATSGVTVNLETAVTSGGAGSDILVGVENAAGSSFADTLIGDGGDNSLFGGAGPDLLRGEGGADQLTGGEGVDTTDYSTAPAGVTVNLFVGSASGGAGTDVLDTVENVEGSGFADSLTGGNTDDDLDGSAGNDVLAGGAGNDVLAGEAGADLLDEGAGSNGGDDLSGGPGADALSYGSRSAAIHVSLNGEFDDGASAEGDNVQADVETVETGSGDDHLTGDAGGNTLQGGPGSDDFVGAAGSDSLAGGPGLDTADYSTAPSAVRVNLATGSTSGGGGNDALTDIENVDGSEFPDDLTGAAGDSALRGGAEADTLDGGDGNDLLVGGAGDDELSGRSGADDLRGGAQDDLLAGGRGRDRLSGGSGFNQCTGGPGRDRLVRCRSKITLADLR
jgi:Ca2+-binding RTX toxin-like protein